MNRKCKFLFVAFAFAVFNSTAYGQMDKNYYTQILHLSDGTEIRVLADDINGVEMIKTDDYAKMTPGEYIMYGNAEGIDSVRSFLRNGYYDTESVVIPFNTKGLSVSIPGDVLWRNTFPQLQPYLHYSSTLSGLDLERIIGGNDTNSSIKILQRESAVYAQRSFFNMVNDYEAKQEDIDYVQTVADGSVTVVKDLPREVWYGDLTFSDWEKRKKTYYEGTTAAIDTLTAFDDVKCFSTDLHDVLKQGDPTYAEFRPLGNRIKPTIFLRLPETLSATYDFYCMLVPESQEFVDTVTTARPNCLNFQLYYSAENGNLANYNFSSLYLTGEGEENPETMNINTAFLNDTTKIDSIYLGRFTFPVATCGVNNSSENNKIAPVLKITSPINVFKKTHLQTYSRTVRLASIIMRPVDDK